MESIGPYQAVIFDMDGVIVDSEPRHERAFYSVLEEIGYAERVDFRFSDYIGRSDRELWINFVRAHQPPQSLDELLAMKRNRTVEILRSEQPLFDGVLGLVEKLAAHVPLALASGSERPIVDTVLSLDGLRDYFRVTVSGSEVERGKPEPDTFLVAADRLGVEPGACVAIEDSKPGVAAALSAGMRVIAITNTHPAGELSEATFVVTRYEEIQRLLLGN